MHLKAMYQSCALVERVEGQLLNERDPVNLDVVHLGPELHTLHLLASHDRPHIWLADAHYPVLYALATVLALEVILLLTIHLGDDVEVSFLSVGQQFVCALILPLHPSDFLQYLSEQIQQPSRHLSGMALCAPSLLPVCQVRFLHIKVLRSRAVQLES